MFDAERTTFYNAMKNYRGPGPEGDAPF
jgi:hypothetical protein